MEKVFLLNGLTCPNCSAKIEKEVGKLQGIGSSNINLMHQTLTVTFDDKNTEDIYSKIVSAVHKYEPDVKVSEKTKSSNYEHKHDNTHHHDHAHSHIHSHDHAHSHGHGEESPKKQILRLAIGAAVYASGMLLALFDGIDENIRLIILVAAYIILGYDVVFHAVHNITKGRIFDENFLMTVSTVGAFVIGEYPEAVAVMLFYQLGEFFQDLAVERSRKSVAELMNIRPDSANVKRNGEWQIVSPKEVGIGEIILVKPGEKVPLDGIVTEGTSTLDMRALTGESIPSDVAVGDTVLSGCVNQSGALTVQVTKLFGESTASKIIDMVENASNRKAPAENFITKFAEYYTPVVVILAVLLAVIPSLIYGGWAEWLRRGCVFLVISCPCALVISVPLTFFGGIGAASKHGVLVKGSNYLEALGKIDVIVFDKTGTLTKGTFSVTEVIPANGYAADDVLKYAAFAEYFSNHPAAKSIKSAYGTEIDGSAINNYTEISGHGVKVETSGVKIAAGNEKLMDMLSVAYDENPAVGTKVFVAVNSIFAGCIVIADEIKSDSKDAVLKLRRMGVQKTVMLTGDNEQTAKTVAEEIGIDEYHACLLPDQKVDIFEKLDKEKQKNMKIAFVGDGINDAPVLARADIGIAMGALGSDAAIEAADVVLMTDELSKLSETITVANATKSIVMQNIIMAIGVKILFLILGALGYAGMWVAVFGDVGVMLLAVINAMRILKV